MRGSFVVVVALVACGKSKEAPPAAGSGSGSAGSAVVVAAGSGSGSAAAPDAAAFAAHVKAGHAAEKAKDWKTAVTELDAAAAARPDDAMTLAELTWAAYFAKQLDHAREIGVRAVLAARAAKQPKLEAMALYNLGLAEADADLHAARSLYKASLDLRPNAAVEKTLEAADDSKPATPTGDALLAKVSVTRIEENRKAPESPVDSKLMTALQDLGAQWDMGAGHGSMRMEVTCTLADSKCTFAAATDYEDPGIAPASGDKAKALVTALQAEGIKPKGNTLAAHIDCYTQDEGRPDGLMPADSCDVTAKK